MEETIMTKRMIDIGRSRPREVFVENGVLHLEWQTCRSNSGCSGCSDARYMIAEKLVSKKIRHTWFGSYVLLPDYGASKQSVVGYLSKALGYKVKERK